MNAQLDLEIKRWQHDIKMESLRSSTLQSSDFMQRNHYNDEGDFNATNEVTAPNETVYEPHQKLLIRIGKMIFE